MLLKQLSIDDKRDFLCIAELLSIADKPVSIIGKSSFAGSAALEAASAVLGESLGQLLRRKGKMPSQDIFPRMVASIQRNERETIAMAELVSVCKSESTVMHGDDFAKMTYKGIETALIKRIDRLPIEKIEESTARAMVALELLRELLKDKKAPMPSVPKVMLFELMLFALIKGSISSIEWQLLNEFRHHHQLENHIFNDLLERAEFTHREAQKTLAIILE